MSKKWIMVCILGIMVCLTACNSGALKKDQESNQKPESIQNDDYNYENEASEEKPDEKLVLAKSIELSKMGEYSSSLELISIWTYEYNDLGQRIKDIEHPANYQLSDTPVFMAWIEYEYDDNGNKVEESKYDHDIDENSDTLKERNEYEYNEQGEITKYVHHNVYEDGDESTTVYEYEYDAQGNKIRDLRNGVIVNECEYDADGYLTKETEYDLDGAFYHGYNYITEVQEDGFKQTAYDEEGNRRFEYEYNVDKILIKEAEYRKGNVYRWVDHVYNSNGYLSYEVIHHAGSIVLEEIPEEGYVTDRIEYEYAPLSEALTNDT